LARFVRIVALFTLLTAIMTWPQAARLGDSAQQHQDVYFNMWRFAWVAHALSTSPARLFDGNIFYPERRALTFSDAMPVESFIAAPMLWAGARPMLVHNIMLLAGIVFSAAGIFVLARSLTGSSAAGVTAGLVFAFAPYRFEHYMHMELQWTVWIPWAFSAVHRALETGQRRYGAAAGVFVALQVLSSIYYGVFLAMLLGLTALLLLCTLRRDRLTKGLMALLIGGALSIALIGPYATLYFTTREHVGERSEDQVNMFSARPGNYTIATEGNYLYGAASARAGRPERRLFPGLLPVLLAIVGLLLVRPSNEAIACMVALAAAFEMSLGIHGYSYAYLYHHVPIFSGLRAPARLGVFVLFFLALLAAYGQAALEQSLPRAGRRMLAAAVCAVLMLEYWVAPLRLVPYPNTPPPLYAWLARQPPGVVAELPISPADALPGAEARYAYMSTFHWMPMVNGYSGFYPPTYLDQLERLQAFPAPSSIAALWRTGVRYVIVHTSVYSPDELQHALAELAANPSLTELGHFDAGEGEAVVYRLR
jgi:hypothetical protein